MQAGSFLPWDSMSILLEIPSESGGSSEGEVIRNSTDNKWPREVQSCTTEQRGYSLKRALLSNFVTIQKSEWTYANLDDIAYIVYRHCICCSSLIETSLWGAWLLSFPAGHETPSPSERHSVARGQHRGHHYNKCLTQKVLFVPVAYRLPFPPGGNRWPNLRKFSLLPPTAPHQ